MISDEEYQAMLEFAIPAFTVHELSFLIFNLPYLYLEFNKIPFFEKYKIQKGHIDKKQLRKSFSGIFVSHFLVILPSSFLAPILLYRFFKMKIGSGVVNTWTEFFGYVLMFLIMEDITFYFSHKLLHTKYFYKRIHKIHHEYTAPVSWAAEYAHPVEIILGNMLPLFAGPLILGGNMATFLTWLSLRIWLTTEVHCGYNFPWNLERYLGLIYAGPTHHDLHHKLFLGNYSSSLTWLDYLMKTDLSSRDKNK